MLSRRLPLPSSHSRSFFVCLACAAQTPLLRAAHRSFASSHRLRAKKTPERKKKAREFPATDDAVRGRNLDNYNTSEEAAELGEDSHPKPQAVKKGARKGAKKSDKKSGKKDDKKENKKRGRKGERKGDRKGTHNHVEGRKGGPFKPISLKEALLERQQEPLHIEVLEPVDLDFKAIDVDIPAVPRLSYGLDRVLFNPGVYRLQDPSSRVYNFDPYLQKIMPVQDFDFDALSEYKTSSRDEELLAMNRRLGTKFTGSTSSMSGILQHFHFLLSGFRKLNHSMLSRGFPQPSNTFSKVTIGPDAIFLRYKDGHYAIDADKSYDSPNIMSWLGHSMEKLLTTDRDEFERYRRSSPEQTPKDDNSSRCYHYSTLGNILMRSQLDAHDPRLPGTGIFDLKTRAVVSIRMDHKEYEVGSGYQIHHSRGEWESFEREFYDMTRATMLKYSLQVRMGRMNGIFVAYHNIERIFGFQYLSLPDIDEVLHGQTETCLGDQEFKVSVRLVDELLQKATEQFPETVRASYTDPMAYANVSSL
jgi:hypothetical protein